MPCLPTDATCPYHPLTHFSGAVCALASVAAVAFTVHAWRGLQGYYAEQAKRPGGYVRRKLLQTPLPLLLRILYLCASATQILGNTGLLWNNWLHVMASTKQSDPIRPVWQPELDAASRSCIFIDKFAPTNYAFVKFLAYCFLFIKQRTVRTMQPEMHWLEKMVLQNTFGIILALAVPLWLVQGDRSPLDGTCVLNVPVPITATLFVSDLLLSSAYLYLFIQPLRETIRLNEARRNRAMVAPPAAAGLVRTATVHKQVVAPAALSPATPNRALKVAIGAGGATPGATTTTPGALAPSPALLAAGTATVPPSPSINPSPPPLGSSPALSSSPAVAPGGSGGGHGGPTSGAPSVQRHLDSLKLEWVMRRNTRAAVVAVAFSSGNMLFCMLAMVFDDPYMRKLVSPLALFDCIVILCTLCYVLHGGKSAAAASREPVYQSTVVSSMGRPSGVQTQHQQPHQPGMGAPTPSHKHGGWMAQASRLGGAGASGGGARIAPIPSALEMPPAAIGGGGGVGLGGVVDRDDLEDGGGLARYPTLFRGHSHNPQASPLSNDFHMTEEPEGEADQDADPDPDEEQRDGQRIVRFMQLPESSLVEEQIV